MAQKTDFLWNNENEEKTTYHDHDKYIPAPEFNKFTAETFAARLAQANLASQVILLIS